MPYGKEAKEELAKLVQGKCLRVLVYDEDRYGRCVGDILCSNGIFVQVLHKISIDAISFCYFIACRTLLLFPILNQELMLKKGFAWHYSAYDQRPELAKVSTMLFLLVLALVFFLRLLYSKSVCNTASGKKRLEKSG